MKNNLQYIGITFETAPLKQRSYYVFDAKQKEEFLQNIQDNIILGSILMLLTCNRMELYFESKQNTTKEVISMVLDYVKRIHNIHLEDKYFVSHANTSATLLHLLELANGLKSAVKGDRQILTQLKNAYKEALVQQRQGKLLERAFQSVFKSHKKINTQSNFQKGSTSTAHLSLKLAKDYFANHGIKDKKILLIGAGDIIKDVLKYVKKYDLTKIYIANRTLEKAEELVSQYDITVLDWKEVLVNKLASFDVIISAVSYQKHLIKAIKGYDKKRIWLDLAVPFNIDKNIANAFNIVYDIEYISQTIQEVNQSQLESIPKAKYLIEQEHQEFIAWLEAYELRRI